MNRALNHDGQGRTVIDRFAKDIEHPTDYFLSDRYRKLLSFCFNAHAPRQSLRGVEGNPPNAMGIELGEHFNRNLLVGSGIQHRVDGE